MSQHDMTLDNASGLGFRTDANNALQALSSQCSGAAAPSPSFPCQVWADTGTGRKRQRNSANTAWLDMGALDTDTPSQLVTQDMTAFTSAGTAPAFTLTPNPAIVAYAANQRFRVKFHASGSGSNTLNISGVGAKNLKQYDASGAKVAAVIASGQLSDVEYDGTDIVVLDPLPMDLLNTPVTNVASAATVNLTTGAPDTRHINITGTTTITGFTVAAGRAYFVRFDGALTLTNGAGLVTNRGTNIAVSAGDSCIIRATAANVIEVICGDFIADRTISASVTKEGSAGGTSIDFTIPPGARRVTLNLFELRKSGTGDMVVRWGVGSTPETSGYRSTNTSGNSAVTTATSTTSHPVGAQVAAISRVTGDVILTRSGPSGDRWTANSQAAYADSTGFCVSATTLILSGDLGIVRVTSAGGAEVFNAGAVTAFWEF